MGKIDLTGQRFGKLLVIKEQGRNKHGSVTWLCKCDCGNTRSVPSNYLRQNVTTSCGCSKKSAEIIDITGKKYGRLTVIKFAYKDETRSTIWECRCDCGNRLMVKKPNLISGNTKSCGCLQSENRITHGKSDVRLYHIWSSMKSRCLNHNNKEFHNYGGRGITVCNEWLDFETFYEWSMANGYNPKAPKGVTTIDRIDVDGNYEPNNCRWVDIKTQSNNKRNSRIISYEGKTQTLSQWAEELGIRVGTLQSRLDVHHWSVEKAFKTPVKIQNRKEKKNGTENI